MHSGQPLLQEHSVTLQISRIELLDLLSKYRTNFHAHWNKSGSTGVMKAMLNFVDFSHKPTADQMLAKQCPWFSHIHAIVLGDSGGEFLDDDSVFNVFLFLKEWTSLSEEGIFIWLKDKFQSTTGNIRWTFLSAMDQAGVFHPRAEDSFVVLSDNGGQHRGLGKALFLRLFSVEEEWLNSAADIGRILLEASADWPADVLCVLVAGLFERDDQWFSTFRKGFPHFDSSQLSDPVFWQTCFGPEGPSFFIPASPEPVPVVEPALPEFKEPTVEDPGTPQPSADADAEAEALNPPWPYSLPWGRRVVPTATDVGQCPQHIPSVLLMRAYSTMFANKLFENLSSSRPGHLNTLHVSGLSDGSDEEINESPGHSPH